MAERHRKMLEESLQQFKEDAYGRRPYQPPLPHPGHPLATKAFVLSLGGLFIPLLCFIAFLAAYSGYRDTQERNYKMPWRLGMAMGLASLECVITVFLLVVLLVVLLSSK